MNNGMRELTEEDLENIKGGVPVGEIFRPVDDSELDLDQLSSVLGGLPIEQGMESLEKSDSLTKERREMLMKAKKELEQMKTQSVSNEEPSSGRGLR